MWDVERSSRLIYSMAVPPAHDMGDETENGRTFVRNAGWAETRKTHGKWAGEPTDPSGVRLLAAFAGADFSRKRRSSRYDS